MFIYVLHYNHALHHSQHYAGMTDDPITRFRTHASGEGAAFTAEMARLNIPFRVGMLAQCSTAKARQFERTLKQSKNLHRYCEECCKATGKIPLQMPGTIRQPLDYARTLDITPRKPLPINVRELCGEAWIKDMVQIARECGDGLGFIPANGMADYAARGNVIGAIHDAELAGYLLYSLNRGQTELTIIQTAVRDRFRLSNIGRTMVDFAACSWPRATLCCKVRHDLPANLFWERLGFSLLQTRRHQTSKNPLNYYQLPSLHHQYQEENRNV